MFAIPPRPLVQEFVLSFQAHTVPVLCRREAAAPWGSGRAERRGDPCRGRGESEQRRERVGLEVEKAFWTDRVTSALSIPDVWHIPCLPQAS